MIFHEDIDIAAKFPPKPVIFQWDFVASWQILRSGLFDVFVKRHIRRILGRQGQMVTSFYGIFLGPMGDLQDPKMEVR